MPSEMVVIPAAAWSASILMKDLKGSGPSRAKPPSSCDMRYFQYFDCTLHFRWPYLARKFQLHKSEVLGKARERESQQAPHEAPAGNWPGSCCLLVVPVPVGQGALDWPVTGAAALHVPSICGHTRVQPHIRPSGLAILKPAALHFGLRAGLCMGVAYYGVDGRATGGGRGGEFEL